MASLSAVGGMLATGGVILAQAVPDGIEPIAGYGLLGLTVPFIWWLIRRQDAAAQRREESLERFAEVLTKANTHMEAQTALAREMTEAMRANTQAMADVVAHLRAQR